MSVPRVARVAIADLHANSINFVVTGMIINKSNVKTFEKHGKSQRNGVINFVVRDSAQHFINLTIWGTDEFVIGYFNSFNIEDIIDLINAKINPVQSPDIYTPITSSSFQLTINEGYGSIQMHQGDKMKYAGLINVPLKSLDRALTLADVASSRITSESEDSADLLVIVCKIKPIKETKNNSKVREVVVVDQSFSGMCVTIWNEAWIQRSMKWDEMVTILHLVNVRFKYSEFHKSIALATSLRTLIVENPITPKSNVLQQHARAAILNSFELNITVDPATITNVMSVQQITDRIQDANNGEFYCLTFATVTQMDLDGCSPFFSRRCLHCHRSMKITNSGCDSENCSIIYAENPLMVQHIDYFNIAVRLTDHTATLDCRLRGNIAERILGFDLISFSKLDDTSLGVMKWKFLLERCCVKLAIKRRSALIPFTQVIIVDCKVADPNEVLDRIRPY